MDIVMLAVQTSPIMISNAIFFSKMRPVLWDMMWMGYMQWHVGTFTPVYRTNFNNNLAYLLVLFIFIVEHLAKFKHQEFGSWSKRPHSNRPHPKWPQNLWLPKRPKPKWSQAFWSKWPHIKITGNRSWCMGIKGEMSGMVCVKFTWDMYIYIYIYIYSLCFSCCSLL